MQGLLGPGACRIGGHWVPWACQVEGCGGSGRWALGGGRGLLLLGTLAEGLRGPPQVEVLHPLLACSGCCGTLHPRSSWGCRESRDRTCRGGHDRDIVGLH